MNDLGESPTAHEAPASSLCWHVTPSVNRDSIAEHGLDWCRMSTTGIAAVPVSGRAGSPEEEGIFLCESLDDVEFFVSFGGHPLVDVWQVDTRDLPIEPGPDGWLLCRRPIEARRLFLLQRDRSPEPRLGAEVGW